MLPFFRVFWSGSLLGFVAQRVMVGEGLGSESYPFSSGLGFLLYKGVPRYPSSILSSAAQLFALFLDIIEFPLSKNLLRFRLIKVFHNVFVVLLKCFS